jgi:hypothetical protein
MKNIAIVVVALTLSGCATVQNWIPSFWDDNQSARIVDVRLKAERLDCDKEHLPQVSAIRDDLEWFRLYSESKGYLQKDVIRLTAPMQETVEDFYKRSSTQQGSKVYCEMKKKIIVEQSRKAASAVLGRF